MADTRVFRIVINPDDSSATLGRAGKVIGVYTGTPIEENLERLFDDIAMTGRTVVGILPAPGPGVLVVTRLER